MVCVPCRGFCVPLFQPPGPSLCATRFVCPTEVCMCCCASHTTPPSPSAPRGLCALQRFVCCTSLSTFFPAGLCGLLWVSQVHCLVKGHSLWAVDELRSGAALSDFCSLDPSCAWLPKILQLPLGSTVSSCAWELFLLPCSLPPSDPEVLCLFLFVSPYSLLPHSRELSLPPGGLGASAVT